jgi:hypothetical protein
MSRGARAVLGKLRRVGAIALCQRRVTLSG